MTMDTATAVDVIDVVLDELFTLRVLPLKQYEAMTKEDREKLVTLLVTRYGERKDRIKARAGVTP